MALDVGVNIRTNVSDFLRGIVSVEAGMTKLRKSVRDLRQAQVPTIASTKILTAELQKQSRAVRSLTFQYGALRRTLLTFAIRTAIVSFTALVASMNSVAATAVVLTGALGNLAGALTLGGAGAFAGAIQGLGVFTLAFKGVIKALTTVGKAHQTAMAKLTQPAKDFVHQIEDIRKAGRDLQLTAQKGLFPGLVEGLREAKKLMPVFKQAVWDTARAMGYLADRAGEMLGRRGPLLENFFKRNTITLMRMGEAVENFGAGLLEVFTAAGPLIGHMTKGIVDFSNNFKNKTREWRKGGQLTEFFADLRKSWDNWTSILGTTGKALFDVFDAIQPVIHKVETSIKNALETAQEWTGSHKPQIKEFFEESMAPMGAFLKAFGRLAETWVLFSKIGNKDAVKFFDAFRTQVIPLFEQWFIIIDEKLLPKVSDLAGSLLDFLRDATPGFKGLLDAAGTLAGGLKHIVDALAAVVRFGGEFGPVGSAIATALSVGALIIGWKGLKAEIATVVLLMRKYTGFADPRTPVRKLDLLRRAPFVPTVTTLGGAAAQTGRRFRERAEVWHQRGEGFREAGGGPIRRGVREVWQMSPPYEWHKTSRRRGTQFWPPEQDPWHPNSTRANPAMTMGQLPMYTGARFVSGAPQYPQQDAKGRWRNAQGRFTQAPSAAPPLAPILDRRNPLKGGVGLAMFKEYEKQMETSTRRGWLKGLKGMKPGGGGGQVGSAGVGTLGMLGGPLGIGLLLAPFLPSLINKVKDQRPKVAQQADLIKPLRITAGKGGVSGVRDIDAKRLAGFSAELDKAVKEKNIRALHQLAGGLDSVGHASKDVDTQGRLREFAKDVHAVAAQAEQHGIDALGKDFESFAARGDSSISKVRDGLAVLQNEIGNKTQRKGRVFREAMSNSFGQAAQQIKIAMDAGTISVKKGMKEMERLLTAQFKVLGFTKEQARHLAQTGDISGKTPDAHSGVGRAVGGFFLGSKGQRGRDNVPMNVNGQRVMAAKGEYVGIFNATQQKAFDHMAASTGHGDMEGFFRGTSRPHYMAGGGIVKLGRQLERQGYDVGENPAFGGVHPVHMKGSLHYSGKALDVNADSMRGGEKANLQRLAGRLMNQGWHVIWNSPGHYDHLHVDTANGPGGGLAAPKIKAPRLGGSPSLLKGIAAGTMQNYRSGAQALLNGAFSGFSGDLGMKGSSGGKLSRAQIAGLMRNAGFPSDQIATGVAVALAESGGDPNISNSIGATGLWQILLSAHPSVSGAEARNPRSATEYAYKLWRQSGWQPWEAYTGHDGRGSDGPYLQYLHQAFGGARAAAGFASAKPPNFGTPPPTNNVPGEQPHDNPKPPKKPKKPKPRKIFPKPPSGIGSPFKPKSKKPKKLKPRKKIKKLIEAGFKHDELNLDNVLDPITGETLDVTKAFLPFQFIEQYTDWIAGAQERLTGMEGRHALPPDEEAIVNLYDSEQFADFSNYIKSIGKDPKEWIAKYGDSLDVVNTSGFTRQGIFVPGILQAVAEIDQELGVHQSEGLPLGLSGGIYGAMNWQNIWANSVDTKGAIRERRKRLRKLKKSFEANVKVRKSYHKKLTASKSRRYTRGQAVEHNKDIIEKWRRWKRDSYGETHTEIRHADHEMDRLRDSNRELMKGKGWRKKPVGNDQRYEQDLAVYQQRGVENRLLVGDKDATNWSPPVDPFEGGAGGLNLFMLDRWKEADSFRTDTLGSLKTSIPQELLNIENVKSLRQQWTGTHIDPPALNRDTSQTDADKDRLTELKKQAGIEKLTAALLASTQTGVLTNFAQNIGLRYLGAFAHGTKLVGETGIALVHKGESITPDPSGPFRNGMNSGGTNTQPIVYVDLVFRDRAGQLVELVDQRVRAVAPNEVSRTMGQRTRVIRSSPGR